MTSGGRAAVIGAGIALAVFAGVGGYVLTRRSSGPAATITASTSASPAAPDPSSMRRIAATLFYLTEDGRRLAAQTRDVPFAEGVEAQARAIVLEQIAPPAAPKISAVPPGTTLRALFVTGRGEAFVDLSAEARSAHTGGSLDEFLTVYTIVNTLTVNLPAVTAVQILIDGKEVDTLAGHVDLRRPLPKDMRWVEAEKKIEGRSEKGEGK